jgi:hypothetical protein
MLIKIDKNFVHIAKERINIIVSELPIIIYFHKRLKFVWVLADVERKILTRRFKHEGW